ncbi:MAG: hypothetical protein ACD_23C01198G0001 [uncultured bacterium]|nr:MAG: hypothetical protein ACD_23C01198G0001 [uncultured bacterium]
MVGDEPVQALIDPSPHRMHEGADILQQYRGRRRLPHYLVPNGLCGTDVSVSDRGIEDDDLPGGAHRPLPLRRMKSRSHRLPIM